MVPTPVSERTREDPDSSCVTRPKNPGLQEYVCEEIEQSQTRRLRMFVSRDDFAFRVSDIRIPEP